MDIRKVQKVSTETYTISLPKRWAKKHRVGAHTLLSVTESPSGSLIVHPHADKIAERTPRIAGDHLLEESLVACYTLGAAEVVVTGAAPDVRARTLTIIQRLPGFEVAEETPSTITLRCMIDETTARFPALLDRLCVLLTYGAELASGSPKQSVLQNEQEINRTYHLCARILMKASHDAVFLEAVGIPSSHVIPSLQLLIKRLEHTGDAIKELPERLTPQARRILAMQVGSICAMVRLFTAGKLAHADLGPRAEIERLRANAPLPQLQFLARTVEDVREELVLLRIYSTSF